jgi:hypothetical protein
LPEVLVSTKGDAGRVDAGGYVYFPFLYGRQSELLAIRSMLKDNRSLESLVPVIEPVNVDASSLAKCIEACGDAGQPIAIIFNPDKHQLDSNSAAVGWRKEVLPLLKKHASAIPTYRCHSGTKQSDLNTFFKLFPERETAIIYSSSALSDVETKVLAARKDVKFHIVVNGKMASAQRLLLPKTKYVAIQDDFNKLDRNADYNGPELFTDRHKTFAPSGIGFGDFAAIGSAFQSGGSTPAAVAIHAIFKKSETGDIWIEHFVSDDKDKAVGDVASKFVQAAKKLVASARKRPKEFGKNFALDAYEGHVRATYFPGLPKNKELQIAHHMCLMLDALQGSL